MKTALYFHGQQCLNLVLTVSVDVFPLPSYSYSSGAVYVWNMADGGGPVCVSCSTQRDQLEPPTPINCAIHQSGWGVIGNCNGRLHCKIGIDTVHQNLIVMIMFSLGCFSYLTVLYSCVHGSSYNYVCTITVHVQEAWTLLTLVRAPMYRRFQAWASPLTLLALAAVEHTQL